MYQQGRTFYAVIISTASRLDLTQLLRELKLEDVQKLVFSTGEVFQANSYRAVNRAYTSSEIELARMFTKETPEGSVLYAHSFYCTALDFGDALAHMLIVPYFSMGLDLFGRMVEILRGQELVFWRVDLEDLRTYFERGEEFGDRMRIVDLSLSALGDWPIDTVTLKGRDTLESDIYRRFVARHRAQWEAKRCAVRYQPDDRQKIDLKMDRFGNFSFYVASGLSTLSLLSPVLTSFQASKLMHRSYVFPPMRGAESIDGLQ